MPDAADAPASAAGPRPSTHQPAAPAATAAAPPATSERRRTDRRRSSTRAAGSGGSPWPREQVLDDGVEVDVERPVGRGQALAPRGPRRGPRRAGRAGRRRAARTLGDRHPEQVGDLVGLGGPDRAGADQRRARAGSRRAATSSSAVSTGSSSSASGSCAGAGPGRRPVGADPAAPAATAAASTDAPGASPRAGPSSRASRHCWCRRGERLGGDPAGRGGVEGDDERDALEVGPARGHELAEVVLDGEGHPYQSHTGRCRRGDRPVEGQRSAAAPSSTSSWLSSLAGSNSPVTSQMTRWPTLTAWSAKRS